MPFTRNEISMLACPRCRGRLEMGDDRLACGPCGVSYEMHGRTADLSSSGSGPEWARWREKLDLLQQWRRETWDGSRSAESRQTEADYLASGFFSFLGLPEAITVLEIGCGGGDLRRYLPGRRYWGLDPLIGDLETAPPKETDDTIFLRSVGERLPLAGSSFDAALLCETLDHCLDPGAVIREARRVLKPGGVLGIMQNVRATEPQLPEPLHRRARVFCGRLKSRLRGRRRLDAGQTKTCRLEEKDLVALVSSEMVIDTAAASDQVIFMRAVKKERAAGRASAGEASG